MARVEGFEPANSGQEPVDGNGTPVPVGVWGDSDSGVGVFGTSGALPPNVDNIPTNTAGVEGHSIQNPGVFGHSIQNPGVVGRSTQDAGVLGVTFAPTPTSRGVIGVSTTGGNGVVGLVGDTTGVVGNSIRGTGVNGVSGSGPGVVGQSFGVAGSSPDVGVLGTSDTIGVLGFSRDGIAVEGNSTNGTGMLGYSTNNSGVVGRTDGTSAAGVFGQSSDARAFAGFFDGGVGIAGNLSIAGTLFKGGGGFMIDHPLDPGNKYLRHSFVESPDMLNVHNGNVTTDANGEASVTLPEYFEALNQDFCYQLTVIGQFAQAIVTEEIRNNQFTIKTDQPRVKVSWQVTGIRRDPWAVANRIAVEEEKAAEDKGRYLHPGLWGRPTEAQIHHRLVVEAGRLAEPHRLEELPGMDRSRVEEEWRQMQELVQRMRP